MSNNSGPVAFILKRGALRLGVVMFIFSTLYIYFVVGDHTAISRPRLQLTAMLCIVLGIIWGTVMWITYLIRERQQRKS